MRVGDTVKIINPEIVIRCGYPKSMLDAENELESELLEQYGMSVDEYIVNRFGPRVKIGSLSFQEIRKGLIFSRLENTMRYGGDERIIIRQTRPQLLNMIATITKRKITYTGERRMDYWGTYLSDRTAHVLFQLYPTIETVENLNLMEYDYAPIWVEKMNLEKITL